MTSIQLFTTRNPNAAERYDDLSDDSFWEDDLGFRMVIGGTEYLFPWSSIIEIRKTKED